MTVGLDDIGEFLGIWRGKVVNNDDPEELSRVQVRIYVFHDDDVPDEDLPWANVAAWPLGNLHGPRPHPGLNEAVWVMFEAGHEELPVVVGGISTRLDVRNESREADVAGDDWAIVQGTTHSVAAQEKKVITGDSIQQYKETRQYKESEIKEVDGDSTESVGRKEVNIAGGRVETIAGTDRQTVSGDKISTYLQQYDQIVAGDKTVDVIGTARRTASNASGTPLLDDAILDEAVNGFATYIAKTILGIEGASLSLDPIGLQTELKSLVRLVLEAQANVVISTLSLQLGGPDAVLPIALLPHTHVSPFLGGMTGPAVGIPGISFTKVALAK